MVYPKAWKIATDQELEAIKKDGWATIQGAKLQVEIEKKKHLMVLNASSQKIGEYAHVQVSLMPAEISQEDFKSAEEEALNAFGAELSKRIKMAYATSGAQVVGQGNREKITLRGGVAAYAITHTYKKSDGVSRVNQKIYIYTSDFTMVVGFTTSLEYWNQNSDVIKQIVESVKVEA